MNRSELRRLHLEAEEFAQHPDIALPQLPDTLPDMLKVRLHVQDGAGQSMPLG